MTPPRPSLPLIVCSLAAILFCTLLTAFCFASALHPWGIRQLGGLLLMPGFLGLGLTQYAATFQSKANRAETAARLYSLGSGFAIIALACVLLDLYRMGEPMSWPIAGLLGLLLLFAAWGRWGGRLNRQWAAGLRASSEETAKDQEGLETPAADYARAGCSGSYSRRSSSRCNLGLLSGWGQGLANICPPTRPRWPCRREHRMSATGPCGYDRL